MSRRLALAVACCLLLTQAVTASDCLGDPNAIANPITGGRISIALDEGAQPADWLAAAVGADTHFNYQGSPYYTNFARVRDLLVAAGIRHIRDGAPGMPAWYYDRINRLAEAGVRNSVGFNPSATDATIASIRQLMPGVEALEGPNEYDNVHVPDWPVVLRTFQQRLYSIDRSTPALKGVAVWGPPLAWIMRDAPMLGLLAPWMDAQSVHDAPCDHFPGGPGGGSLTPYGRYGEIAADRRAAAVIGGDKPLVLTETGYSNNTARPCFLPEAVTARYDPRMVFERWMNGFQRTYFYQFSDMPSDPVFGGMGLVRADGTPKPQYNALAAMIALLSDRGPAFRPSSLKYSLEGVIPSDVHHLLLEKSDGHFFLALWRETSGYDSRTKLPIEVAPVTVDVRANGGVTALHEFRYDVSSWALVQRPVQAGHSVATVMVDDTIVFLELHKS